MGSQVWTQTKTNCISIHSHCKLNQTRPPTAPSASKRKQAARWPTRTSSNSINVRPSACSSCWPTRRHLAAWRSCPHQTSSCRRCSCNRKRRPAPSGQPQRERPLASSHKPSPLKPASLQLSGPKTIGSSPKSPSWSARPRRRRVAARSIATSEAFAMTASVPVLPASPARPVH